MARDTSKKENNRIRVLQPVKHESAGTAEPLDEAARDSQVQEQAARILKDKQTVDSTKQLDLLEMPPPVVATVLLNYPTPTMLSEILEKVCQFSGKAIILEPQMDCSIQIFAPRPLPVPMALRLFEEGLRAVGLRMVGIPGEPISRIVKKRTIQQKV